MSTSCDVEYDFSPALSGQIGQSAEIDARPQALRPGEQSDRAERTLRLATRLAVAVIEFFSLPEFTSLLEHNIEVTLLKTDRKRHG